MIEISRRKALITLAFGILAPSTARAARRPRVLFVCQAGTVKSAVARELLRKRARTRGISLAVASRGIAPADHMTPSIRQRLIAEYGIDPASERVRALRQTDLDRADIVVLFDMLPTSLHRPDVRDWTDQPSVLGAFDAAMAYLDTHIDALLADLVKPPA